MKLIQPFFYLKMTLKYTFKERSLFSKNIIGKKLFEIMDRKESNLCFSVDLTNSNELLKITDIVGPYICCLKTHSDIVVDWNINTSNKLIELSKKHDFLIFEDRKFADIGNTVIKQCKDGYFSISSWANIINAHALPGPGIINGLKEAMPNNSGLLLIAEMSSSDNLFNEIYIKRTLDMALENMDFVFGFISQNKLRNLESPDPLIIMTPGVNIETKYDTLGQNYNSPDEIITKRGCDIGIVGRGIYSSNNPLKSAQKYRKVLWDAYQNRLI